MNDDQIKKIAEVIAAKLGQPGGPVILGCGDASSSTDYDCSGNNRCTNSYECGGAGTFRCTYFDCQEVFDCDNRFNCAGTFNCYGTYNS